METLSKAKGKYLRQFLRKKLRKSNRKCLVEGEKLCGEALDNGFFVEILVYARGGGKNVRHLLHHSGVGAVYQADRETLRSLSDVETPPDVVGLAAFPGRVDSPGTDPAHGRYVILDSVSDPGNCGAVIRSASWFGWDGVLCGSGCVEITSSKVIRSSMGAVFHIPVWENLDLTAEMKRLKKRGFTLLGTVPRGGEEAPARSAGKTALVIGNEATGISESVRRACDALITITGSGKAESLNAAVSAGILLDRLTN